jgi:ABC-type Zn uptake system ZnuABC Zn-binding protein ZnuA
MNVPANVTRAAGDVHALGNPHFTVDPIIAKAVAQHIAQSFSALDPTNAAFYQANYKKFEATINAKLQEWGAAMVPFHGQHVVAYHDSWPYFAHRFGVAIDIFLEPKPGIPPSPSHLTEVIAQMKGQHIKAVIVEPFHDRRIAEKVATATGAKVVEFSQFPGGLPGTDSYVKLIDTLVSRRLWPAFFCRGCWFILGCTSFSAALFSSISLWRRWLRWEFVLPFFFVWNWKAGRLSELRSPSRWPALEFSQ